MLHKCGGGVGEQKIREKIYFRPNNNDNETEESSNEKINNFQQQLFMYISNNNSNISGKENTIERNIYMEKKFRCKTVLAGHNIILDLSGTLLKFWDPWGPMDV